ncbi:hypothetical protein ACF0H5_021763 [Mactra antiquata]
MKYLSVLIITVCQLLTVTCQISMVPCDTTSNTYKGPPLPRLQDQFTMNIEANIVQKNLTMNFVEYYDYNGNKGRIDWYNRTGGDKLYTIMDFSRKESWMVFSNHTCRFLKTNSSHVKMSFMVGEDSSHIKTVKQLLYFGEDLGEIYVGTSQVRGIITNHWRTCVKIPATDGRFTLDYYFSKASGYFIDGKEVEIPVRAVINGTGKSMRSPNSSAIHTFYHIYDFYDVKYRPIRDQDIFQVPPGIVCNQGDTNDNYLKPKISQQFSTTMELTTTTPDRRKMTICNVLHADNVAKIYRFDTSQSLTRGRPELYGQNPMSYIHDSKNGILYIIDKFMKNCSTVSNVEASPVVPSTSMTELPVDLSDYKYQGQKTLRGIPVYSWGYYNSTTHTYIDILFQSPKPPRQGQNNQPQLINPTFIAALKPVGLFQYKPGNDNMNATYIEEHIIDFTSGHIDYNVFDVSTCYALDHHSLMLAVDVTGQYMTDIVRYYTKVLISKVRQVIADTAKVSPTRISSIQFELRSAPDVNVDPFLMMTFELLDNKLAGLTIVGPSLQEAYNNLKEAWKTGNDHLQFDIKPTHGRSMTLSIRDGSLWEIQPQYMTDTSTTHSYGPGAMVGLALGMLVIGAILGLLAAYVIYKKIDTSVPYQVTD